MASPAIEELSLLGLFGRVEHIDQLKSYNKTGEEEVATIASEGAVKKAIASQLDAACSSGISSAEKVKAKAFLEALMKAIDPYDKHAAARRDKLTQLLGGIEKAPPTEELAHVKRARDAVKRVQKEFKESHETYEKWERGKLMFKTNDELKAMQQRHRDCEKCLEDTKSFLEDMISLRSSDARPPALASAPAAARPKAKTATRAADPCIRTGGGGSSGYPSAKSRSNAPAPGGAALLQARLAAEVRAEADAAMAAAEAAEAAQAPKPARPPRVKAIEQEEETVVLSYSCTCRAVAEICRISVDKARDMAESSSDFKRHLDRDQWTQVKERSLAIEKEDKEKAKEKEQRKKDSALARITEKQGPAPSAALTSLPPSAVRSSNNTVGAAKSAGKAKPAPKPKTAAPSKKKLVQGNRFGGLGDSDDDDDDGWTTVQR